MGAHSAVEADLGPSGEGTVVIDIGGDRGAAVIVTPGELSGEEIEIRPVDLTTERPLGGAVACAIGRHARRRQTRYADRRRAASGGRRGLH